MVQKNGYNFPYPRLLKVKDIYITRLIQCTDVFSSYIVLYVNHVVIFMKKKKK